MSGQVPRLNILFAAYTLYESFGQTSLFSLSDGPPDDESTEDVQDYIEVKVGPPCLAFRVGAIPLPDRIGP